MLPAFQKLLQSKSLELKSFTVRELRVVSNSFIGTHSGTFHCDEVLAVFLLQKHPKFKNHVLWRTRNKDELSRCEILVDIGGVYDPKTKRFDHHQSTFKETFSSLRPEFGEDFSSIKLSSAGLIYVHYGEEIISEILKEFKIELSETQLKTVYLKMYSGFIKEIDAIDNGIPQHKKIPLYRVCTDISSRVRNLNPDWKTKKTPEEIDVAFAAAVKYVGEEFINKLKYFAILWLPARTIVEDAIQNRYNVHESGCIIELEKTCPWQEHLMDIEELIGNVEIKFIIYKGVNNDYRVHAVPVEQGSFMSRNTLNKKWFGKRDEELELISGIKGAIFVHQTGFTGGHWTREGAIEMAIKSLNGFEVSSDSVD
ncbi:MYG1 protein-like [Chironomus tepperi]|uniref:MYG1 protein-like n=1 Tax=Chironomus tepperi TaxID=113505 RepID=UPI00391F96E4